MRFRKFPEWHSSEMDRFEGGDPAMEFLPVMRGSNISEVSPSGTDHLVCKCFLNELAFRICPENHHRM